MKGAHSIFAGFLVIGCAASLSAAELTDAKVTRLINEVSKTAPGSADARPVALGDVIRPLWQVSTGDQSRSELTFNDLTLVRLGANTLFEFKPNEREVNLRNGTILVQVPKKHGGAVIETPPITAAVTGTTVLCEYTPGPNGVTKWIVIEGQLRVTLKAVPGESIVLNAGQMIVVPNDARHLPDPSDVDLERLLKTSKLINDGPFTIEEDELISAAVLEQRALKTKGGLLEVNYGLKDDLNNPAAQIGTVVSAVQNRHDSQPPAQPPVVVPPPAPAPPVVTPMPTPPPPTPFRPPPTPRPVPTGTGTGGPPPPPPEHSNP